MKIDRKKVYLNIAAGSYCMHGEHTVILNIICFTNYSFVTYESLEVEALHLTVCWMLKKKAASITVTLI